MRELGKYFKIYCHKTHKKWPELVPYIENWLNSSVNESTGYAPMELLSGDPRLLKKEADQLPKEEVLADKLLKTYARMKLKAEKRNKKCKTGRTQWKPCLQELILVKCQPASDAIQGITRISRDHMKGPTSSTRKLTPTYMSYVIQKASQGDFLT
jgi:hypothetical protein